MNLRVTTDSAGGWIDWGQKRRRCAIGSGGIGLKDREGDGITPRGSFAIREIFYRADRIVRPKTWLETKVIHKDDAWCDDPFDSYYNKLVKLPYSASVEHLWREDHLYDLLAVLGYNDDPVVAGKGSAIFLHVAKQDYAPTQGCMALNYRDMVGALQQLEPLDIVEIF